MGRLLAGALLGILIAALAVFAFLWSGGFNVAASAPADWTDSMAPWVFGRSLAKRAGSLPVTVPTDAEAIARGAAHYKENCLPCHGAPGVKEAEFSQGMNPMVPGMDSPMIQGASDAQLFWIVKNGIRMSGMPAFGRNHTDAEIGDILAFVRHIPKLDASEKERLRAGTEEHHHHDADEHDADHHEESGEHHHDH
jgi:mono/diheme cytochrome c family protein